MQRVVLEQRLGFVATVTAEGRPNLSPKGTTTLWDEEHLMFADLASPGTIENLATNPHVEINVVDPILRKGYRFKGTAAVYTSGQCSITGWRSCGVVGQRPPEIGCIRSW
jgi:predicted pyridoxine 5'-phosphate oxidase superfamily flavin-nucleotide-binding protein